MERSSYFQDGKSKYFTDGSGILNSKHCVRLLHLKSAESCHGVRGEKGHTSIDRDEPCCKKSRKCTRKSTRLKKSPYFVISKIKHPRHFLHPNFAPPVSPFNLIQEEFYSDPWKVLVATIFLSRTAGKKAIPVLREFLVRFNSAEVTINSSEEQISQLMKPLGLHRKRAQILMQFSKEYLNYNWEYPIELFGIGKYGNDSYRMFCIPELYEVTPTDYMLKRYHRWMCHQFPGDHQTTCQQEHNSPHSDTGQ